jgi:hypothetical protein
MEIQSNDIVLKISLQEQYIRAVLPVFQVFSKQNDMEEKTALRFQLTAEEFLIYFKHLFPDEKIEIRIYTKGKYCSVLFTVYQKEIDLSGLNLVNPYREEQDENDRQDNLSLLLISRSVDKLDVFLPAPGTCSIEASFERFSAVSDFGGHYQKTEEPFRAVGDNNVLLQSLQLGGSLYPGLQQESCFRKPEGFLADRDAGGLDYICAVDHRGIPAAFLYWRADHGTISFFGPYVFSENEAEKAAAFTVEQFLAKVGKEECYCVVSGGDLPDCCKKYFEIQNGVCYRNVKEDGGGIVWSSAGMMPVLKKAFEDMDYSREILPARFMPVQEKSLINTRTDKEHSRMELVPLIIGRDFPHVLEAHVKALAVNGKYRITIPFCLNDMLQASAMDFAEQCGFSFYYFLPGAGTADKVVMAYDADI